MPTHPRHDSSERPAYSADAGGTSASLDHLLALAMLEPARHDADLRRAVRGFTRGLKEEGQPPEKVLVALKTQVARVIAKRPDGDKERALMARSVEWCITEYFRDD